MLILEFKNLVPSYDLINPELGTEFAPDLVKKGPHSCSTYKSKTGARISRF